MKKIMVLFLSLVIMVTAIPVKTFAVNEGDVWDGSISQPSKLTVVDGVYYYEISTAEELAFIVQTGGAWLTYNYMLTNNIILNSQELTYDEEANLTVSKADLFEWIIVYETFTGKFVGENHTISGLYGNPLFSSVEGTVSHVNLENIYVDCEDAAGICHYLGMGTIENCTVSGCIRPYRSGGAGIANSAGRYGQLEHSRITNCINYAYVYSNAGSAAGIIYDADTTHVVNCVNYGDIYSNNKNSYEIFHFAAGIIGDGVKGGGGGFAYDCVNYGKITGCTYVGGITGYGDAYNSTNYGEITGNEYVGGVTGRCSRSNNVINKGKVTGDTYVGGVFGYNVSWYETFAINVGEVNGTTYVGGIVGYSDSSETYSGDKQLNECINIGDVSGIDYVGGIAGTSVNSGIHNCYMIGNVTGETHVGAIAGEANVIWATGSMSECYYLKTETANTSINGVGGMEDLDGMVYAKDMSFFCIDSEYKLNKEGHSYKTFITYPSGNSKGHIKYVCENCNHSYQEELKYIVGDIDGVKGVTDADAEYLLMYTFFPEDYPVNQSCDFNGDGKVNDADAEHLLMHTFFPEDYPLK